MKRCRHTRKTRALHIISGDLWAGAEAQVYYTICDLAVNKNIDCSVITFNSGILRERLEEKEIKSVVFSERKTSFEIILKVATYIRQNPPDILHVHGYKEHIIGTVGRMLSGKRIPIIRTYHGVQKVGKAKKKKGVKSRVVNMVEKFFINSSYLIAVSKDLKAYLDKNYRFKKSVLIYNGLPDEKFNPCARYGSARKTYQLTDETFWIGTLARLEKVKNLDMLIDAGKILSEKGFPFRISIFGNGALRSVLQEKINRENLAKRVFLEGFVEDPEMILSGLDAFVLSSTMEGLPISLLEAMAMKTSVVCTDVGGMKEVIEDGKNGFLVPVNDAHKLAETLIRLRDDEQLRIRMGENARKKIVAEFTIKNTNKQLLQLYKEAISQNDRRYI